MSIASLGIVGGLAGTALPQRAAEIERTARETTEQQRAMESVRGGENAAGIGQTEEDSQTSDRDAAGRRLWDKPEKAKPPAASTGISRRPLPLSKVPSARGGGCLH